MTYNPLWNTSTSTAALPTSALTRYVDAGNGSDSNNGLSPSAAYLTPAAGLSDLQTYAIAHYSATGAGTLGVGKLICLPGAEYDLGASLVVDYRYPVEIVAGMGAGSGLAGHGYGQGDPTPSPVTFKTTSSSATELIKVGQLGTSTVGYGFSIRGITLQHSTTNTALTALLRILKTTRPKVIECHGVTTGASAYDVPLIEHDGGTTGTTDGASFAFVHNVTQSLPLLHAKGGNLNRGYMGYCECQFGSGGTYPMVWIEGGWYSCLMEACALEGGASGPHVKMEATTMTPEYNTFLSNGGESATITYPFYDITAGDHNQFIGGMSTGIAGVGTWIKFGTNAYPNAVHNTKVSYAGTSGVKAQVVDNSSYPATNVIHGLRNGRIYYQKTGTAPTFSSSDFPAIPPDGALVGTTYGSTGPTRKLWSVINGTYVSTVMS